MPLAVTPIPPPVSADPEPSPDLRDLVSVERAHHRLLYGHEDLVHDEQAVLVGLTRQERTARLRLLARDRAGRAVGAAHVTMPRTDNQHLAMFFPSWDPGSGADETEVYDALWAAAEPELVAAGRSSVHCWAMHPGPEDPSAATWLTPRTGTGRVAEDRRATWLAARGFVLEQVELYSVLELDEAVLDWARESTAGGTAYRIRTWVGATPPELRAGMARLYHRMSVDVPTGGIDYEGEHWDEAAVVADDERQAALGGVRVTTVALTQDGVPVAYTVLEHQPGVPASADQDDTFVHGEHRGHGLGLRVKAANLLALHEAVPTVRRVHTWNAAENAHMLAINTALGFEERGAQGGWQRRG